MIFKKYYDHPMKKIFIFSNEWFEDLLVLIADCRVDHLSTHRYKSMNGDIPETHKENEDDDLFIVW